MKIRSGFVSNSSSSSFICDFCKEEVSGWDMYPVYYCVNGHASCEDCKPDTDILTDEDKINAVREYCEYMIKTYSDSSRVDKYKHMLHDLSVESYDDIDWEEYPAATCPICRLEIYDESEMCLYLYKKYGVSRDQIFARVKAENKRRKKLHDSEYITIVCRDNNVTVDQVMQEIRDQFVTWDKYNEFLATA